MAGKKDSAKRGANALYFIASLFFLYVVIVGSSRGWWSTWITTGAGATWLPIAGAVAVLASIVLFLSGIVGALSDYAGASWKLHLTATVSLLVLTVSTAFSTAFWIVIVGFIIGWIGSLLYRNEK
jgi:hypothetical protein